MTNIELALLAHVPENYRPEALETLLKINPTYFVEPIDEAAAAELLNRTPAALSQMRVRRLGRSTAASKDGSYTHAVTS